MFDIEDKIDLLLLNIEGADYRYFPPPRKMPHHLPNKCGISVQKDIQI